MSQDDAPRISFCLPRGLLTSTGHWQREGFLRLATGADELYVSRQPQAQANPAYARLLMLARTVEQVGEWRSPTAEQLGTLFLPDFTYLIELFNRWNPPAARRLGEPLATRSSGSTAR